MVCSVPYTVRMPLTVPSPCVTACRRSAVARQCAHLFAVLAAALGIKFEQYAITFMTAVYKGLVITVQVCHCTQGRMGYRQLKPQLLQSAAAAIRQQYRADLVSSIKRKK